MGTEPARNRFAVPLSKLESEARTPEAELVEEIAEPPNPDLVPEERRRLESFLKWGTQG